MVPEGTDRERLTVWLVQDFTTAAPAWLMTQRWFGAKSRSIDAVGVEDVFWLPLETGAGALVVLEVRYAAVPGDAVPNERYAIVVSLSDGQPVHPAVCQLPSSRLGLHAVESVTDGPVLLALLHGLVTDAPLRGDRGGEIIYGDATSHARTMLAAGPEARPSIAPVGAEQSNTSVRVGTTSVFKLFRRLEDGVHPQLEIGRFLAQAAFGAVPALEGSLVYRSRGGLSCALGALEAWVANEGDGWSYVVTQLEKTARNRAGHDRLARDMRGLGTTTADFHVALTSDSNAAAFAPEPVTQAETTLWLQQAMAQHTRTFDLIERERDRWPEPARALGRSLVKDRRAVAQRLRAVEGHAHDAFRKIRIHGDFHLGQTLKTPDGFVLIDFEGEPTKPLPQRRQKHCALRDVAGMLRSLDYAEATVRARLPVAESGAFSAIGLREAFVDGYRSRALTCGVRFLPSTSGTLEAWLEHFELEKALYEVEYEANNRPAWVQIPLRAVAQLLAQAG